jgi:predicted kinase
MVLDQTGEIGLSDACLKGFLTVYNDSDTLRLLNFYKCYRAYVRVKIACFMLNGLEEGSEKYLEELDKLKRLLDLSLTYALNMIEPKLVIYYGLMGSGKSKNSKMLNQKLPSFRVNTDEFRKEYFNIDKVEKVNEDFNKGIYSYENSLTIYKELGKLADEKLKINRMTIVDGSFSKKEYLRQFQENINIKPLKIKCEADDNTILKRLADRKDKKIATDGRPELYFKQKESFEDIGCDFLIDTTSGVEENIEKTIKFLISNEK